MGIIKNSIDRFSDMKLNCDLEDNIKSIYLLDKYRVKQGEFIKNVENGIVYCRGFYAHGNYIGKIESRDKGSGLFFYYFSIISPGVEINEEKHKKELALFRLGGIECPQLLLYLKDYGYEEEK